jgi:CheY-like chemotaxis protein
MIDRSTQNVAREGRILVVNDNVAICELMVDLLGISHYDCRGANSSREALSLIESGEEFDLILADLRMPDLDGVDLLEHTKDKYPDLPVVMVTPNITVALDAIRNGAYDYVLRPCFPEEMFHAVRRAFENRRLKLVFRAFSAQTANAFYKTLPFPIAIVYRKVANAPNSTQRFSLLIELFEVVIRFIVLVQVADHLNGSQQAEVLAKIPELSKLSKPALGDWVKLFRSLSQFQTASAFLKEVKLLKVNEYQKTIDAFVNLRNESFKGHGATLTEAEYEQKFQEHAPSIYELIGKMSFLANYRLVKAASMEKDGDYYRIFVQTLMGDNPVFETQIIPSRIPLETRKVLYLNANLDPLVLDPYMILEPCTECHRTELLLLDKFSEKKVTYLGYESGHKPPYAYVGKLPLALREVASR